MLKKNRPYKRLCQGICEKREKEKGLLSEEKKRTYFVTSKTRIAAAVPRQYESEIDLTASWPAVSQIWSLTVSLPI
jgi:hypothetical protein